MTNLLGLVLLSVPLVYEAYALLSQKLAVLPRVPSYSEMVWRTTADWSRTRKIVVATIATAVYVTVLGHFFLGWLRGV